MLTHRLKIIPCALLAVALFGMPQFALAQIAGDQYYDFERDSSTPRGADDSTTGSSVIMAEEAEILVSPSSLSWSGEPSAGETPQVVTVTNGGRLMSLGQINISMSNSNFTLVGNGCSSLSSGESCEVMVKPRSGQTGNFNGAINITSQSGKSKSVPLSANLVPPTPPVENVDNCEFPGGNIKRRSQEIESGCSFTVTTTHTYTFRSISTARPRYAFPVPAARIYRDGVRVGGLNLTHSTGNCRDGATRSTHRACYEALKQQSMVLEPGRYTVKWYNSGWDRGSGTHHICYIRLQIYSGEATDVNAAFGAYPNKEIRGNTGRC